MLESFFESFFKYMPWDDCAPVVLVGFTIVFIALVFLVFFFSAFGKIMNAIEIAAESKKKNKAEKKAASAPKPAPIAEKPSAPVVEDGISDEIIAVISAAVASMSDGDKHYALHSVKKSRTGGRPVWAMAGLRENTSSFQ